MGDADDAQFNAVQQVFGVDNDVKILVCFYRVAAKVYEKTRKLPPTLYSTVARGLSDLHYATTEAGFLSTQKRVLEEWSMHTGLDSFRVYFTKVWLASRFWRWQIFHTPPVFATTNNPVESFNATLKRDYTLRTRMKVGSLLRQLMACCTHESTTSKVFALDPTPSVIIVRRANETRRAGILFERPHERRSIAFLLNDADEGASEAAIVNVVSLQVARIYDPESKRTHEALPVTAQLGKQTARMEVDGMPENGWAVNTQLWLCPCLYWAKHAYCVHTLLAKHVRGVHVMDHREKLVYRGGNDRKSGQCAGRPRSNPPAL